MMIDADREGELRGAQRTLRHDLRTPINHITNYAQLARDDAEDLGLTDLGRDLDGILEAARNALGLIGSWLDPEPGQNADPLARAELERTGQGIAERADELALHAAAAGVGDSTVRDLTLIAGAARTLVSMMHNPADPTPKQAPEGSPARGPRTALGNREARPPGEQATILVADDDHLNRDVLGRLLDRIGHNVVYAENGRLALEVLNSQRVDMVLLDVMMPELDGYQVLQARRNVPALRDIPVVVISGYDDVESVGRCIEMGAEDYLTKPFDADLLRARLNACLEKKRWRDQEVAYLQAVSEVANAAVAVEEKTFKLEAIAHVAARTDELGHLARVVQHMASEVSAREERLTQQVLKLTVQVDEARKVRQLEEITSSTYFKALQERAKTLRGRRNVDEHPETTGDPTPIEPVV